MKTEEQKQKLIDQIRKTPIIQIACEKTGVGRATYYRWKKNDENFRDQAEEALLDGESLVNDMAESQLISAIRDQNLTAIIFWLKNHHKKYKNKVELSGSVSTSRELTPEEEELIKTALAHAGISEDLSTNPRQDETTKKH
jgi:predicted DNA binding protein